MRHDMDTACLAVLAEIAALGSVRRDMLRAAGHEQHGGGAAVMWHLLTHGPLRLSDLAAGLRLDLSVVSRQVSDLVASGHVDKRRDPHDGRSCVVHLTEAGNAAVQDAVSRLVDRFTPRLAGWRTEDLLKLAADLRRARQELLSSLDRDDDHVDLTTPATAVAPL
jgi:DNA-binding MarR family transcriptional regulator